VQSKDRESRGEVFWMARGIRQGCPLSLMLFNIIIADKEEYMKKRRWRRTRLGEEKIYTLMYGDDIVLLAEKEQEMKALVSRLEKYLDEKGLKLNMEKTKIKKFRKEEEEKKKLDCR